MPCPPAAAPPQQGAQSSSSSSSSSALPAGELSVPEGPPDPEQLPRSCRLYAQEAAQAGAGEDFPDAPMSPYGMQGLGTSYSVHMADGSFRGLEWGAGMVHGSVPLREIEPEDRLVKGDDRAEVVWAGGKYRSFALSVRDCAIPNLMPDEGRGVLLLNIMGDCTVDGGGPEYECFGGFDCVYITGSGALTLTNTAGLGSGGGSLTADGLDQAELHRGDAAVLSAAEDGSICCATDYSREWAPSVGGTSWEDLTAMEAGGTSAAS